MYFRKALSTSVVCQVCYLRQFFKYFINASYYYKRWLTLASPTRLSGWQPESKRLGSINMIEPARV